MYWKFHASTVYVGLSFILMTESYMENSGFVEKKTLAVHVKYVSIILCLILYMHAGTTCTCIFLSSAHKHPAHLTVIGGAHLLETIICRPWHKLLEIIYATCWELSVKLQI